MENYAGKLTELGGSVMRDFLNREITVGDRIVYAIRSGNVACLKSGTVLEITEREHYRGTIPVLVVMADGGTKPSRLENIHNVVVIPKVLYYE